ncbi:Proteasome subunit beta type-6 [Toxocara canis]|uniref:proteasome endopeptidase complex n=1 Tax=Toxocara canis TaxID=6265 RepID=A0A0B2VMI5_TOXCA|nr:Proteasome subunit beta type-6 [Toxocara canis]
MAVSLLERTRAPVPGFFFVFTFHFLFARSFIASRATDKITQITDRLVVCRSGSAADTQAISDIVKYYIEVYSLMENEEIGIARASQIFRNFLYRYRDDLSASVLLYAIPLGGYVTRQRCTASGSGSTFVQGFLDNQWRQGLTVDQCKEIVKTAVSLATYRDGSSGGVIRLAVVDKNGTTRTLIRPDTNQFPKFVDIPAHLSFPKHIVQ